MYRTLHAKYGHGNGLAPNEPYLVLLQNQLFSNKIIPSLTFVTNSRAFKDSVTNHLLGIDFNTELDMVHLACYSKKKGKKPDFCHGQA